MTNAKLFLVGVALSCTLLPIGCTALLGGGYTQDGPDSGSAGHPGGDSSAPIVDGGGSEEAEASSPGVDACAVSPTDKPGFESNLCGGQVCTPGDNGAVLDNGYCGEDGGAVTCVVPVYAAPDASSAPQDAGGGGSSDDAGSGADASADAAPPPGALPSCRLLAGSSPIASNPTFAYPSGAVTFAMGSTAIQPYVSYILQEYAAGLSDGDGGTFGATIVYVGTGSCVGVEAAYAPPAAARETMVTAMKNGAVAKVSSGGKMVYAGTYYDPAPPMPGQFPASYSCAIDPNDPDDQALLADVGFSDVFPSSCTTLPYPAPADPLPNAAIADLFGPVQIMEMVVPTQSPATSITFEEAELVWGYGGAAKVAPWTDSSFLFRRSAGSGTQTMIGAAIALDPRVWQGVSNGSSSVVVSDLKAVVDTGLPDGGSGGSPSDGIPKALGILSSDYTDNNSSILRPLAFQDRGESCAWLPDSSTGSFDKRNVRDGHYPIWGPSHVIAPVQGGVPSNPIVNHLYAALNGLDPDLAVKLNVIELYATNHLVPTCAMHVSRTSDGQSYTPYAPAGRTACSCYYDSVVPQDKPDSECTSCKSDSDCTDPTRICNIFSGTSGFCEVKGG